MWHNRGMKVSIIAALTADGFIGRDSGHTADWTPKEDKKKFIELTKTAGIMVMGSRTFDTIGRPLPGRKTILYTSSPEKYAAHGVVTTQAPPNELIAQLETEGYAEVAICGGAQVYDMFLRSGVVTDLYLTIVPILFGTGVTLLQSPVDLQLELTAQEKLNENTVFYHYKVI